MKYSVFPGRPGFRESVRIAAAIMVAAHGIPLQAQHTQIPERTLGEADTAYPVPFRRIAGFRELPDGRVLVADGNARTLDLIDLKTGIAKRISGEGRGAREYGAISTLLAMPGDETWLVDLARRRLLVISPEGSVEGALPLSILDLEGPPANPFQQVVPIFADGEGRLYDTPSISRTFLVPPDTMGQAVQISLVRRWHGVTGVRKVFQERASMKLPEMQALVRVDTVHSFLRHGPPLPANVTPSALVASPLPLSGNSGSVNLSVIIPFAPSTELAIGTDGSIVVARARDYTIERLGPSMRSSRGGPFPWEVLPVTREDLEELEERYRGGPLPFRFDLSSMPSLKPSFAGAIHLDRANRLWVPLSRRSQLDPVIYEVIDAGMNVVERVTMPQHTVILAFGNGAIYTRYTPRHEEAYVQRHPIVPSDR